MSRWVDRRVCFVVVLAFPGHGKPTLLEAEIQNVKYDINCVEEWSGSRIAPTM